MLCPRLVFARDFSALLRQKQGRTPSGHAGFVAVQSKTSFSG
jgi:hypothetical protein